MQFLIFLKRVNKMIKKAVVVFSGGQDSTTCLIHVLSQYDEIHALTFDYGQRHRLEIEVATNTAKQLGITHHVIDATLINTLAPSALTRSNIEVSSQVNESGRLNTFVPGRNIIFISLASIYAYQVNAQDIVTGVCKEDHDAYPDCRSDFVKSLNSAINLGIDINYRIRTPLIGLDKAETWALADHYGYLDFIKNQTLTCYQGVIGQGCGQCPACSLRLRGLDKYLSAPEHFKALALKNVS